MICSSGGISEPGVCPADDRPLLDLFTIDYTSQPCSRKLAHRSRHRCRHELCCSARQQPDRNARLLNFAKTIVNLTVRHRPLRHNFPHAHHTPIQSPSITFAAWGTATGKVGYAPESNGEKLAV